MSLWLTLASEGPNGKFIPADPKELYFGAAAFFIVLYFLVTKLFPIINKALGDRGDKVEAELAAAEEAQAAADAEVAALKAKLGDAEADAQALVDSANRQADKLKSDAAAKADADADAIRERAASDIEGMRAQAQADLQAEVTGKALSAAEDVVRESLDDATQNDLIESYINQVSAS